MPLVPAKALCTFAQTLLGRRYLFGAKVPKNDPNYQGPFDCAEWASYVVYQTSAQLYGCAPGVTDPAKANAFTGHWATQSLKDGSRCSVDQALGTVGAFLLRAPGTGGTGGHIALSAGDGSTFEAHSTDRGVILLGGAAARRWTCGVLTPGYQYEAARAPRRLLRLKQPRMMGDDVATVQRIVHAPVDGSFGPETAAAVVHWQAAHGMLADGEVGPLTWAAMDAAQ